MDGDSTGEAVKLGPRKHVDASEEPSIFMVCVAAPDGEDVYMATPDAPSHHKASSSAKNSQSGPVCSSSLLLYFHTHCSTHRPSWPRDSLFQAKLTLLPIPFTSPKQLSLASVATD